MSSIVVFHRHGHRAPTKNLFKSVEEANLWSRLVPDSSSFLRLDAKLPVRNDKRNPTPRDVETAPFGMLTAKGLQHMEVTGQSFAGRFGSTLCQDPKAALLMSYATNYQRTMASGQAFISGVLSNSVKHAQLVSSSDDPVTLIVRDLETCGMQFYEGKPVLAERMISRVKQQAEFRHMEGQTVLREAVAELFDSIPTLERLDGQGMDWLAAFDYYVCRREHSLLNTIPSNLRPLEQIVTSHMAQRYRLYYKDEIFGSHFALPLLEDLCSSAEVAVTKPAGSLIQFSCHDVNLLGLLRAIAPLALDNAWWPGFGSTVCVLVTPSQTETALLKVFIDQASEPLVETSIRALRLGPMKAMQRAIESESF